MDRRSPSEAPTAVAAPRPGPVGGQTALGTRLGFLTAAAAIATAGLLRAARGYRSFPSIDDFAYIPMALARLNPHLYTKDTLLQQTPLHMSVMPALIGLLQTTTGIALGFWLITTALSLLTILALYRWMRALGLPGAFLPLVALLACAGTVQGLGRGEYDGVFGDAFHFQWAALCALLWAYDAVIRGRWIRGAGLVALAFFFHPVVGSHGAVAVACAWLFARAAGTGMRAWLVPAAVAACAFVATLVALRAGGLTPDVIARQPLGIQALLFRTHEFEIDRFKALVVLLVTAAGIAGVGLLLERHRGAAAATALGLLAGHLLLVAGDAVLYDPHVLSAWSTWTVIPLQLSLSRTTPLLLALGSVGAVAGLEAGFFDPRAGGPPLRGAAWFATRTVQAASAVALAVVQVRWSAFAAASIVVAAVTAIAVRERVGPRVLGSLWLLLFAGGMAWFTHSSTLSATVKAEQEALFRWARSATPANALFVIPPSLQEFRLYAQRSVYVDFKTMTPADFRSVESWWERLQQVAAPDRLALGARGWEGVPEWDRTYAGRNTPARIAWLLGRTGADYFVWDKEGLRVPPFVERVRAPHPDLVVDYQGSRYVVYRAVRSFAAGQREP